MTRLTLRRIEAIREALAQRIAGENETDIPLKDYERALQWANEQADMRQPKSKS